jgi:DNA end-binding protein Ku
MAARPTWSGHLRLSLVTCPVALYNATSSTGDIHFNLINPETGSRIKMVTTDAETGKPVSRGELVKGYEVEKGRYIILTPEEIAAVKLESTRVINIERFVDADEIDRLYWNAPYFLMPDGKLGLEAFAVIREAMVRSNKVALGRVVLHTRERLVALEPRGKGIVATTLRTNDEVRSAEQAFAEIGDVTADEAMVDIASRIIEQQGGAFEPAEFNDRYEDALRALIAEKEGKTPQKAAEEPGATNVVDLMSALKASLSRQTPTGRAKPEPKAAKPAPKAGARRPPAKKRA